MKHIALASLLLIATQAQAAMAPAVCPAGQVATTVFYDGLEGGGGNFLSNTTIGSNIWFVSSFAPITGTRHLRAFPQTPRKTLSSVVLGPDIRISHNRYYLQFSHAFGFEAGRSFYDGGTLLYSRDGGATVFDAGNLIISGQRYNGVISSATGNPLGGDRGFVGVGGGVTRLSLASSSGGNFSFGFVFGSDNTVNSLGWHIDDIHIYRCESQSGSPPPTDQLGCVGFICSIPIPCPRILGVSCDLAIKILVSSSILPSNGNSATKAPRQLLFASGATNIPPGQTKNVRLNLQEAGKQIARTSTQRNIRGVMDIRSSVANFPPTPVRIKLPRL